MTFKFYTQEDAPKESQKLLRNSQAAFGMIPNLHAVMAGSAPVLEAYQTLHTLFQQTSFNAEELTVVWQTINVEHACHYCIPAHTGIAHMMNVDNAIIEALRSDSKLPSEKLQVLHATTLALVRNRGHLSQDDKNAFISVGYEERHLLEIVLGISQKVMSNYVNHLADTPVDDAFKKFE